eukprot:TRINITY_DN26056_c0_g1_i1.p1 TRINITY_DN26056_c0_g1~~TRINITY_DN26056_c0_g1_i1.p1  ORF type:complete len:597 (-),score=138.86 TRINITY_DN26056_c0_g1_i1:81-1871(-)
MAEMFPAAETAASHARSLATWEGTESVKAGLQIFSGTAFACLSFFVAIFNVESAQTLRSSNYTRRLQACVGLALYVAQFSSFFNYFQLTELDDMVLDRPASENSYSIDMSRPVEWICTCPLLQLGLVVLGGEKIPYYRTFLMPGLALGLLVLGVGATLLENVPARIMVFVLAFFVFSAQAVFNRKQIIEATDGQEGLLHGRSLYRILSLEVIATWIPFPFWYLLTPEGFNVIQDVVTIEVGWVILNITSKFSFIILVHKMYRKYLAEQEELRAAFDEDKHKKDFKSLSSSRQDDVSLKELARETLRFLGLEHRLELFLKRLTLAQVQTSTALAETDEMFCKERSIPWELARACQLRLVAAGKQDDKVNSTSRKLLEAVAGGKSQEIEAAKKEAEKLGVPKSLLAHADARLKELTSNQMMRTYLKEHLDLLLKGEDVKAIEKALEVAKAASVEGIKDAEERLKELKKMATDTAQLNKKGIGLVKNKDHANAVQIFSQGIELQPDNTKLLLNRANSHKALSNWEEAISDATKVLKVLPDNTEAMLVRAQALKSVGEYKEALRQCYTALERDPKNERVGKVCEEITRAMEEQGVEFSEI